MARCDCGELGCACTFAPHAAGEGSGIFIQLSAPIPKGTTERPFLLTLGGQGWSTGATFGTFVNSWSSTGSPYFSAGFTRKAGTVVVLRGRIEKPSPAVQDENIMTGINTLIRPVREVFLRPTSTSSVSGDNGMISITPAGEIKVRGTRPSAAGAGWMSLDGLTYMTN